MSMVKVIMYYEYARRLIGSVAIPTQQVYGCEGKSRVGRARHAVGRVMLFGAVHDSK